MPNLDDFYAFRNTSDRDSGSGGGGFLLFIAVVFVLTLLKELILA